MRKPQDGEDGPAKHRPLPSVDMALLPHELRALRVRQVALGTLALLAVGVVVALTLSRSQLAALGVADRAEEQPPQLNAAAPAAASTGAADDAPEPSTPPPGAAVVVDSPNGGEIATTAGVQQGAIANGETGAAAANGRTRVVRPFGKARGFRDALVKAGASGVEADALIAALDGLVDFRHGQPEHELIFERDTAGLLQRFEYRAGLTERYGAERAPDGAYSSGRIEVEIERRRISKGGHLSDSLGRALEALGLKNSLAGVFVEAFEGKIDFKKDAREGDSFRVIMEEEYVDGQLLSYGKVQAIQYIGARTGEARAFWYEPGGDGDFYDEHGRALHGGWLRTPLRYDHISSPYNLRRRHPILKRIVPHHGIDYAAAPGTTVWAAADGVVTFAGARGANGNLVSLEHASGYETHYAHLLRVARGMKRGVRVKQRQPIGQVGSTGRSTGPHLHFALKRNGRFVDPASQLNGPGRLMDKVHLPKFKRQVAKLERELAAIVLAAAPAPASEAAAPQPQDFAEEPLDL